MDAYKWDAHCKALEDKLLEWFQTNFLPCTISVENPESKDYTRKTTLTWDNEISVRVFPMPCAIGPQVWVCIEVPDKYSLEMDIMKWPSEWTTTCVAFRLQELGLYRGPPLQHLDED